MKSLMFLLLLVSQSLAQLTVDVTYPAQHAVIGLLNPVMIGDAILVDDPSKPELANIAVLKITSEKTTTVVSAFSIPAFEPADVGRSQKDPSAWILAGSGEYIVMITASDPGLEQTFRKLTLGPALPPTPPTPVPGPVEPDGFGNVGQRASVWAAGLPKRIEWATCYETTAKALKQNPLVSVNDATTMLQKCRADSIGTDLNRYDTFLINANADIASRWPMAKGVLADYYLAIAKGVKAAK